MFVDIIEINPDQIQLYAEIPAAFKVESIYQAELINGGIGGIKLKEVKLRKPYIKDYDAYEDGGPARWLRRFDVSNWGFFLARDEDKIAGGATIAYNSPGVHMLAGRTDLAVLWDIRVYPDYRKKGIGAQIFNQAADWARQRKCNQLKIETQNVNVPACKFYKKLGCYLGEINRYAYANYPEVADEIMLIWYYDLT
jgi:GNAT superfamily N-acetyltransferase